MKPTLPYAPIYYTAKGYRWLLYILAPPLILLFLAMPFLLRTDSQGQPIATMPWLFLSAVGVGMAVFFIYGLLETVKGHLAIEPTRLRQVGVLKTKELAFADIKGLRRNDKYTFVFPKVIGQPKIKIASTTERFDELNAWLRANFPDLDQVEAEANMADALASEELGRTPEERSERLAQARLTANVLNVVGGVAAAWVIFYPQPYQLAVAAALLVPLLAAGALWWHQGVLRLDEASNSAYPSVLIAIGAPSLGLILRTLFDVEFVNYQKLWSVVLQVGIAMAMLLALSVRGWLFDRQTALKTGLTLVVLAAMYGYGATAILDTAFDNARGQAFHTQVVDKHSSHGKTTTYYLKVAPWGPIASTEDVQVAAETYNLTRAGSTVQIRLRPGWLGVSWFVVEL